MTSDKKMRESDETIMIYKCNNCRFKTETFEDAHQHKYDTFHQIKSSEESKYIECGLCGRMSGNLESHKCPPIGPPCKECGEKTQEYVNGEVCETVGCSMNGKMVNVFNLECV